MRRVVLLAALAAVACDHPPLKEVEAAQQQVARARAAGAERYAPERWKQAEEALMLARERLQARDYQGALSATNDAGESARLAIEAVGPAKAVERKAVEVATAEVRATLDLAATERISAAKAGVPRATLAHIDAIAQRTEEALAAASAQIEAADVKDVLPAIDALRAEVAPLPQLYRAARTQHAKRPKPRPRSKGRRR